jgi:amino acid permease
MTCTFNLAKVIMGAGMMAVPKAFSLLGWVTGSGLLVCIHILTFMTLAGLVDGTRITGVRSYGGLVHRVLGRPAGIILQVSVFLNCYLMNVVFVVVLGDILVGDGRSPGVVSELFPGAHGLAISRPLILGLVSLCVLLPLASMRSMERLAVVNIIGVLSNAVFAAVVVVLVAAAGAQGALVTPNPWPHWSDLGPTPVYITLSFAAIAPVLLNCDVCHQSLHPLMPLLKPYTPGAMKQVVWWALSACNTLYILVGIGCVAVFGPGVRSDVLASISAAAMGPLVGHVPAHLIACTVRFGYLFSLVGSYVLLTYPLRQCIGDVVWGDQDAVQQHWQWLTVGLVSTVYGIACFVPSIWGVLGLVGATASTVQAWIIPGLVILTLNRLQAAGQPLSRQHSEAAAAASEPLLGGSEADAILEPPPKWRLAVTSAASALVTVLGVLLFINGFLHELLPNGSGTDEDPDGDNSSSRGRLGAALFQQLRVAVQL